jgi:hypothetical protein
MYIQKQWEVKQYLVHAQTPSPALSLSATWSFEQLMAKATFQPVRPPSECFVEQLKSFNLGIIRQGWIP